MALEANGRCLPIEIVLLLHYFGYSTAKVLQKSSELLITRYSLRFIHLLAETLS